MISTSLLLYLSFKSVTNVLLYMLINQTLSVLGSTLWWQLIYNCTSTTAIIITLVLAKFSSQILCLCSFLIKHLLLLSWSLCVLLFITKRYLHLLLLVVVVLMKQHRHYLVVMSTICHGETGALLVTPRSIFVRSPQHHTWRTWIKQDLSLWYVTMAAGPALPGVAHV